MTKDDRNMLQQIFIRVCRDSGFTLEWTRAARIAALAAGTHPLVVWCAMDAGTMEQIADGTHPALNTPSNGDGTNTPPVT